MKNGYSSGPLLIIGPEIGLGSVLIEGREDGSALTIQTSADHHQAT